MLRSRRVIVGCLGAALAAATVGWALGSESPTSSGAAGRHQTSGEQAGHHYSPFVVRLDRHRGELPFDTISFKDVGMSVSSSSRPYVYESIAQSLSNELASHPAQPVASRVVYSKEIVDPSAHLHCESGHIYVDIWQDASNDTWGYSLWSGCGEEDQFAHEQLGAAGDGSLASVEPLTRDIASSLHRALETGCFTRRC